MLERILRRGRIHVLTYLAVVAFSCNGSSTGEDGRRAELLDRDPLLTAELEGVRFEGEAVAGPGSGPGPGTYWTEASRRGRVEGDPREVLLEASETASRFGWTITEAHCSSGGYLVDGWKQFEGFVALLSMGWNPDSEVLSIRAETPPINAGGGNVHPVDSDEVDLSTTCLARSTDDPSGP